MSRARTYSTVEVDNITIVKNSENKLEALRNGTMLNMGFQTARTLLIGRPYMLSTQNEIIFQMPLVATANDFIKNFTATLNGSSVSTATGVNCTFTLEYSTDGSTWNSAGTYLSPHNLSGSYSNILVSGSAEISGENQIIYIRLKATVDNATYVTYLTKNIKNFYVQYTTDKNKVNIVEIKQYANRTYYTDGEANTVYANTGSSVPGNIFPFKLFPPNGCKIKVAGLWGTFYEYGHANSVTRTYKGVINADGAGYSDFDTSKSDAQILSSGQSRAGKFWGYTEGLDADEIEFAMNVNAGYGSIYEFFMWAYAFYEKAE